LVLNTDGTFTYTPHADYHGADSFTYRVQDGNGGTLDIVASIMVNSQNDAPRMTSGREFLVAENSLFVGAVHAVDDDGSIVFSLSPQASDNQLFSIDPATGELRFRAAADFESPQDLNHDNQYDVEVLISDGILTVAESLRVTVTNQFEPATAISDQYVVPEGGRVVVSPDSLVDNDLIFETTPWFTRLVQGPSHGSLTLGSDGTFTYDHDGSETVMDTFRYEIVESNGHLTQALVLLNVLPVDDPTVARDDVILATGTGSIIVSIADILSNDSDVDSAITGIVLAGVSSDISVRLDGSGNLIIDPIQLFAQSSFSYVAISNGIASNVANVEIIMSNGLANSGIGGNSGSQPTNDTVHQDILDGNDPFPATGGSTANPTNSAGPRVNSNGYAPTLADASIRDVGSLVDTVEGDDRFESLYADQGTSDFLLYLNPYKATGAGLQNSHGDLLSMERRRVGVGGLSDIRTNPFEWIADVYGRSEEQNNDLLIAERFSVSSVAIATAGLLSLGYATWMIRGGVLLTTFVSSLPAWQSFDPLVVVEAANRRRDEGESIEEIVEAS
jgi:hypothetical protein